MTTEDETSSTLEHRRQYLCHEIGAASRWMRDVALPFWADTGIDGRHGFVEHMTLGGTPADVDYKRVRVQARQVYVFSHASVNGYADGLRAAENGWEFLRRHGWTKGGHWARRLDRHGGVLDETADLYDHAFALLAIAWWMRASGDDALAWALRTLEAIDAHLGNETGEGWWSESGRGRRLLQNPHMHLLEGCLAAYDATGQAVFKAYATRIVELFRTRLFDEETGTLAESFDASWRREAGPHGVVVEPGHHYEWVWLLLWAGEGTSGARDPVARLFDFSERIGCDPSGLVYDVVSAAGAVLKPTFRLWPNTEALKAHLVRFEQTGTIHYERVTRILRNLLTLYVGSPTPPTWIDQLDANRHPSVDRVPTSSLYHLHLAISEAERVAAVLCPNSARAG